MNLKESKNKNKNNKNAGKLVTLSLKNPTPTAKSSPHPAGFSEYKTAFTQKLSLKVFNTFEIAHTKIKDGNWRMQM